MHDRRKDQRVMLNDACIIQHSEIVGTVKDISMGGVSCTCLDQGGCGKDEAARANIYCNSLALVVENLPMMILESRILPGKFSNQLVVRECRARFHQLEDSHKDQLTDLIIHSSRSQSLPR